VYLNIGFLMFFVFSAGFSGCFSRVFIWFLTFLNGLLLLRVWFGWFVFCMWCGWGLCVLESLLLSSWRVVGWRAGWFNCGVAYVSAWMCVFASCLRFLTRAGRVLIRVLLSVKFINSDVKDNLCEPIYRQGTGIGISRGKVQ